MVRTVGDPAAAKQAFEFDGNFEKLYPDRAQQLVTFNAQVAGSKAPEAESLEDKQLHYRVRDPKAFAGKRVVILGGGDSAAGRSIEITSIWSNGVQEFNRTTCWNCSTIPRPEFCRVCRSSWNHS